MTVKDYTQYQTIIRTVCSQGLTTREAAKKLKVSQAVVNAALAEAHIEEWCDKDDILEDKAFKLWTQGNLSTGMIARKLHIKEEKVIHLLLLNGFKFTGYKLSEKEELVKIKNPISMFSIQKDQRQGYTLSEIAKRHKTTKGNIQYLLSKQIV